MLRPKGISPTLTPWMPPPLPPARPKVRTASAAQPTLKYLMSESRWHKKVEAVLLMKEPEFPSVAAQERHVQVKTEWQMKALEPKLTFERVMAEYNLILQQPDYIKTHLSFEKNE